MITLNGITLPDDLIWSDEFAWSAVRQSTEYSLSGALLVEESARQAGRPITLTDGWASRALVQQLYALIQLPAQTHTLAIAGIEYSVMFRHAEGAMTATPVQPVFADDVAADDFYMLTLRFMVV